MEPPMQVGRKGLRPFITLWLGQVLSQFGSSMTSFAISIWLFEQTQSATALTTAMTAYLLPNILFGPFAGTIVDRFNRKHILIFSDLMAAVDTFILLVLFATGNLQVWHIIVLNFLTGAFMSVQWPASSAVITMLVDKENYSRASGLQSMGGSLSQVLARL